VDSEDVWRGILSGLSDNRGMPTLLTDLVEISGSDVHGFTFRLWFPTFIGLRLDNNPFLVFFLTSVLKTIAAQVCWIGIESRIQESLGVI
jgi:hypothetical protein